MEFGEIIRVAFIKRQPFSFTENQKDLIRQKSISSALNSAIKNIAYGQAGIGELKSSIQKGWDTASTNIGEVEKGYSNICYEWVQIGDTDLLSWIESKESDPLFGGWVDSYQIEEIKNYLRTS